VETRRTLRNILEGAEWNSVEQCGIVEKGMEISGTCWKVREGYPLWVDEGDKLE
jgi:hypothetical protein